MSDDKIEVIVSDEEIPTTEKRTRVVEIPVFTKDDKKRLESSLNTLDRLAERAESIMDIIAGSRVAPAIAELRESMRLLLDSVQDSQGRLAAVLMKAVEGLENNNQDIAQIRSDIARFESKINALEESINKKIDGHVSILNSKLDSVPLQTASSLSTMGDRIDTMKKNIREDIEFIVDKSVDTSMRAATRSIGTEIRKINSQLASMRGGNVFLNAAELRKLVRGYRVTKRARRKKALVLITLKKMEDNITDIFVLKSVTRQMTKTEIMNVTKLPDSKLRRSLDRLAKSGLLAKKKKGRYFVFSQRK